jgi:hypothetical protein
MVSGLDVGKKSARSLKRSPSHSASTTTPACTHQNDSHGMLANSDGVRDGGSLNRLGLQGTLQDNLSEICLVWLQARKGWDCLIMRENRAVLGHSKKEGVAVHGC